MSGWLAATEWTKWFKMRVGSEYVFLNMSALGFDALFDFALLQCSLFEAIPDKEESGKEGQDSYIGELEAKQNDRQKRERIPANT